MTILAKFKENTQKITRKAVATAVLGTVLFATVQKAAGQYLRIDHKSPTSTLDNPFRPSVGIRAVTSYTHTYQGVYPDFDVNLMFNEGKHGRLRAEVEANLCVNFMKGNRENHYGPFVGIKGRYGDDFRDFGSGDVERGSPQDQSRAILAAQAGFRANFGRFRPEITGMIDTKGRTYAVIGMNFNLSK